MPLAAFVPKQEGARDALRIDPPRIAARGERIDPSSATPAGAAATGFLQRYGGEWRFSADSRTARFDLILGTGIPLIPGRGNDLGPAALESLDLPDGEITLGALEPRIREFLETNAALVVPERGTLVLNGTASQLRLGGRLISFNYDWHVDGIPVDGARVFVRVNSGNITQIGAPLVGAIGLDTRPLVGADAAADLLLDYTGDTEIARLQGDPELVIETLDDGAGGIDHRLVWKIVYRLQGRIETWEGRVDAHAGRIVGFRDTNAYASVVGGVYPRTVFENNETLVPMPAADVVVNGTTVTGDNSGAYSYSGGTISSGLNGRFFDTSCEACSNPAQPMVQLDLGSGRVDFGLGGVDEIGNGASTPADRNSFFHLNQVRRLAKKWLSGVGFLDQTNFTSNVNIQSICNAVYTGNAVNFYRSGGDCNNTGEIADVVYHEYGHGIDGNTNGGDGATGEATSDVVSMHLVHSPLVGPGFRINGDPVRDLDSDTSEHGLLTVGNVLGACSCGPNQSCGPLGAEVHCEGQIYGQAAWDLSQALVAKHGHHTGWRTSERIFFTSLPDAGGYLPTAAEPVYNAYINADDDDGNPLNGTPNAQEIFDALDLHGMANGAVPTSPACARPAQPVLSVTPQCGSFDLSWSAAGGTEHYEIFRAEVLEDMGFFPIAEVPATQTSFSDPEVVPGVDYWYVVMSVNATGCESRVENPAAGNLPAQPILSLSAAEDDDEPMGNRSGFPDPGEDVDLSLTLQNLGQLESLTLSGSLTTSAPGVTILLGDTDFDDLAPGASGQSLDALRFQTDDQQVACGEVLDFRFVPSDAASCLGEDSYFSVALGERVNEVHDDFETDLGWQPDLVNSTATTGTWTLGDPEGTAHQPEDDVTLNGSQCWFTAPNPGGGGGTDDVDDGVVILLSPIFDLSQLDIAEVAYYRWFSMSEAGTDSGDFFAADVSDNGGLDWVNLETLDFTQPAPGWTERRFNLGEFIQLTSQVQFRFQAADGVADGSLVEAAIDEFRIDRLVCDDTPACFIEPSFTGLQSTISGPSCGEVSLSWQEATSNCINAEITYNVYRSTQAGFTPGPGTLAMEGLTTLSVTDSLLDPEQAYHYIVRAFDSRSGEDGNLIEQSAVAPAGPDLSPPSFGGLDSVTSGATCGETVLDWSAALESCSSPVAYDIYRSTDPGFVPGPANFVATTFATSFVDAGIQPGTDQTYVVLARDTLGNSDANNVHLSASSGVLDLTLLETAFEPSDGGWAVTAPDDATAGNWEWGNPSGTPYQPEDDATPSPGVNAWITGLAGGAGNGDVDDGTTTLVSMLYDIAGATNPVVRYARWFTNDKGGSPGDPTDTFRVEVSSNNGTDWTPLEEVGAGTPLAWVPVEIPLPVAPTNQMRFRFSAADIGAGSLVEAGIDDFALVDLGQGCSGCGLTLPGPCALHVGKSGDDIIVDWGTDVGRRVIVYRIDGCGESIKLGTVESGSSFVHVGAALSPEAFNYRVTSVDACGSEIDFCGVTDCR
jgi:hypothetical protein